MRKRLKSCHRILYAAVAITMFVVLLGCPAKKPAPSVEYKIGAIFATTGPASMLGLPEKNTVEMLEEEINQKGGVAGGKIKVIVYDTEGDATKTVIATNKLIKDDQVDVIIGPTTSGNTLAIVDIVEKAGFPLISCAASIRIVEPVKNWVFKTPQTDVMAVEKIYEKLQTDGIEKIAIITVSDGFGDSGKVQLERLAAENGLSIVANEKYGPKDTDMTSQLTKIKGTDAEALICWGTNPGPAVIAKNRKQLGMTIPLYNSHGVASMTFIELAGDAAEGTFLPAGKLLIVEQLLDSDPQKNVLASYKKSYEERFNSPVNTFGGHAYDAMWIAVKAIENVHEKGIEPTRENIRNEIERII